MSLHVNLANSFRVRDIKEVPRTLYSDIHLYDCIIYTDYYVYIVKGRGADFILP